MTLFFLFTLGLACWFFSTVAAGGAATILIPIITLFLGAQMVAPIISVAAIIANPTRVYAFRNFIDWKVIVKRKYPRLGLKSRLLLIF